MGRSGAELKLKIGRAGSQLGPTSRTALIGCERRDDSGGRREKRTVESRAELKLKIGRAGSQSHRGQISLAASGEVMAEEEEINEKVKPWMHEDFTTQSTYYSIAGV